MNQRHIACRRFYASSELSSTHQSRFDDHEDEFIRNLYIQMLTATPKYTSGRKGTRHFKGTEPACDEPAIKSFLRIVCEPQIHRKNSSAYGVAITLNSTSLRRTN